MGFEEKELLDTVGTRMDNGGGSRISMQYKMGQAAKAYWADKKEWEGAATAKEKLRTWVRNIQPVGMTGSRSWAI